VRSGDRRNSVLRVQLWRIVSGRYRYAYDSLVDDDGVVTVDLRIRVAHLEAGGGKLNRIFSCEHCLRFLWVSDGCNRCSQASLGEGIGILQLCWSCCCRMSFWSDVAVRTRYSLVELGILIRLSL
jgi:hypothetical protein